MLRTTLRQLVSISGRAILAIGLTSATVLALAPSAKAEDIVVENVAIMTSSYTPVTAKSIKGAGLDAATSTGLSIGTMKAQNNSGTTWKLYAKSSQNGFLKINAGDADAVGVAYTIDTASKSGAPIAATGNGVTGATLLSTGTVDVYTTNATTSELNEIQLDVIMKTPATSFANRKAGDYKDTITVGLVSGF
ncbi:hypothetical protein VB774_11550 [Pseudanabaena galeata UHCC 0370]|uniref:WxL domain-containing protein n=1 Tax=Pseudanabaena galeata UHCC 0370 TaxID=3110310 RepID=A0ABU5TJM9_9CYAN|nr:MULTISPECIES: hypothetical protein [Pseudanabaena]MEA5478251.1 hypothetical protein [Pseudanabaena galeata UHCC 0370]MEA5487177.1 hypothetical protein [Pseudanabaena sp. CCNP1317]WGS73511.1 hypothetical protein OA858_05640 [Pseudanabaena galeata CCNP1313]